MLKSRKTHKIALKTYRLLLAFLAPRMDDTKVSLHPVHLHVIPHFNSNECVLHNYLFEKDVFIKKLKGHQYLR